MDFNTSNELARAELAQQVEQFEETVRAHMGIKKPAPYVRKPKTPAEMLQEALDEAFQAHEDDLRERGYSLDGAENENALLMGIGDAIAQSVAAIVTASKRWTGKSSDINHIDLAEAMAEGVTQCLPCEQYSAAVIIAAAKREVERLA